MGIKIALKMKSFLRFLLILFLLLFNVAFAYILNFNGYISDNANIISGAKEQILNEKIEDIKNKTSAEIAVVTLNSLEGKNIEDVSLEIGRNYGIGKKDKNNGILILVAPNEKEIRIEVGYGLEGILNDSKVGRIIDIAILPHFKLNKYEEGIENGINTISDVILKNENIIDTTQNDNDIFFVIVILVFFVICFIVSSKYSKGNVSSVYYNNKHNNDSQDFGNRNFGGGSFGGGGSTRKW